MQKGYSEGEIASTHNKQQVGYLLINSAIAVVAVDLQGDSLASSRRAPVYGSQHGRAELGQPNVHRPVRLRVGSGYL